MNKQMYYLISNHYWGSTICVANTVSALRKNIDLEIRDRTGWVDTIHKKDYANGQDALDAEDIWHDKYKSMGYIDADALLY